MFLTTGRLLYSVFEPLVVQVSTQSDKLLVLQVLRRPPATKPPPDLGWGQETNQIKPIHVVAVPFPFLDDGSSS